MKKFYLQRNEDLSGVSGIGIVAEGVEFSDGTAVIRWLGDKSSTGVYASVRELMRIHGHEGKTIVVWAKDKKAAKKKNTEAEKDWEDLLKDIDVSKYIKPGQTSPSPDPYINPPDKNPGVYPAQYPWRQPFQERWPERFID